MSIGQNSFESRMQAKYLSAKPSKKASSGISRKLPDRVAPALFIRTSQRPALSFTKACRASQFSSFFRLPAKVRGFGPELPISCAALSRLACEEAARTVCAPSRANEAAIALADAAAAAGDDNDLVPENSPILASLVFLCRRSCRVHSRRDQRGMRMSDFYVAVGDTTTFSQDRRRVRRL